MYRVGQKTEPHTHDHNSVSFYSFKIGEYLAKLQATTCLFRALCALG